MAENITETAHLLVVSREAAILRPLWSVAEPNCWQIEAAANAWDAIERVQSGAAPDLLLLDFPRGDSDCLHILRWMRRIRPDLPILVICSAEDAGRKREAIRLGAQEVLVRPIDETLLESAIQRYLTMSADVDVEVTSEDIEQLGPDSFFVSASPATQKLRAQAELLAEADVPVLILGESGSGKDTVARLIHKLSVRSGFQFLKVNCADMPEDLLETELFGIERASFTANGRMAQGKIERADKGTILLDEIAEMPMSLQNRLVQILQDKAVVRTGSDRPIPVDVRMLAATSVSVDRALAEKKLREDLYYRLSAFTVQVPPLRQRKSEIPVLLQHAMHKLARHYCLPPRELTPGLIGACQQHSWPGNLSELESFVKRYLVAGNAELAMNGMSPEFTGQQGEMALASVERGTSAPGSVAGERNESGPRSLKNLIQDVKWEAERNAIGTALQKTGWNRKAAARLLQVSYRTLLYKIDQYHMSASEPFLSPAPAGKYHLQAPSSRSNGKEQR